MQLLDILVVDHLGLEQLDTRPKKPLESVQVQKSDSASVTGDFIGVCGSRSGALVDKRHFTKVLAEFEPPQKESLTVLVRRLLYDVNLARLDEVDAVRLVVLVEDELAWFEHLGAQRVCYFRDLRLAQCVAKQWHRFEQHFVVLTSLERVLYHQLLEVLSIQAIES